MLKLFEKAKKVNVLKEAFDNPKDFVLIGWIEDNDEIAIRIKRKERKEDK